MKQSGINVNKFGSHSARSASTSECKISGLSLEEIVKSARGSNEKTFAQFYDRTIQEDFLNYLFRLNLLFSILICIYMVLFIQETYMVLIVYKIILIRLRKILDH